MNREFLDFVLDYQKPFLPGELGFSFKAPEPGIIIGSLTVAKRHMAPNGYMHAGSVVAFADTACGYGTRVNSPEGAESFTTIELKSNFFSSAKEGDEVSVSARLVYGGRTTQVWDAEVISEKSAKTMALFRCTQLLIYPKKD